MPDDDESKAETTFTRAQVRSMIAAEVRKVREEFADYGDLKTRAEAADAEKGKIDQVLDKLAKAEQRAADAEAATMRREVADELGLSPKQARRLTGKSRDELLADGREMIEDMGIKVKTPTAKKATAPAVESDEDEVDEQDEDETDDEQQDEAPAARPQSRRPARPREALRSGAPRTPTKPDELDPAKLAALIPRR